MNTHKLKVKLNTEGKVFYITLCDKRLIRESCTTTHQQLVKCEKCKEIYKRNKEWSLEQKR